MAHRIKQTAYKRASRKRSAAPRRERVSRPKATHIFLKERNGHYVEERWCADRIFDVESFSHNILDPSCGWGTITHAANAIGKHVIGFDLVNRRRHDLGDYFHKLDFLRDPLPPSMPPEFDIVCNPPFDYVELFCKQAVGIHEVRKVAMIMLARRLNAAHWLEELPVKHLYFMTPRPSMPTGEFIRKVERGERDPETGELLKVGGGTQDFVWIVFDKSHTGPRTWGWLHRDRDLVE